MPTTTAGCDRPPGRGPGLQAMLQPGSPDAGSTTHLELRSLDSGRLVVNQDFLEILQQNGLATFDALFNFSEGRIVRAIKSRSTARVVLHTETGSRAFYLKRHVRPRLGEWLRPLMNLGRPILGARNEWLALLRFRDAGIPTMTPVACGESCGRSLLITEDLGTEWTLLDWVNEVADDRAGAGLPRNAAGTVLKHRLILRLASIARRMHEAGLHHQDFYLNHILWRGNPESLDLRVIDLGRAGKVRNLSRRWIVKDLAQLDFSARRLSCSDRLRFLRHYLARPFSRADRRLVRWIAAKSRRIAEHTARHGL